MNAKLEPESTEGGLGRLLALKAEVIQEMATYKSDRAKLQKLTDWLQRELDLEERQHSLWVEMKNLAAERSGEPQDDRSGIESSPEEPLGGKARARECRNAYLEREKQRGRALSRIRGIYYKGAAGQTLGVTWSSEDQQTWFFNLKEGRFQESVLLCEDTKDSVRVIRLPKSFLDKYGRDLSRDKQGMIKFFVQRRAGRFELQVPGAVGWVDVSSHLDAETLKCPHKPASFD